MSDWIIRLIEQSGYLGVGFLMFLETVFPPIPSEVIMSVAGVAAGQGKLHYGWVVAAGTAGAMLGNILWYLAARALGIQRLEPFIRRWGRWITMSWAEVKQAERWFSLHGTFFVFLGRLLPTVRSLVSIPAGLLKMSFRRFLLGVDARHCRLDRADCRCRLQARRKIYRHRKSPWSGRQRHPGRPYRGLYLSRLDPPAHAGRGNLPSLT